VGRRDRPARLPPLRGRHQPPHHRTPLPVRTAEHHRCPHARRPPHQHRQQRQQIPPPTPPPPNPRPTAPIPPRLEVLALVGPGGVAARLRDIEDSWRKALGWTVAPWRGSPAQAVPQHATFLTNNLLWACSSYESAGQDIDDLRTLHAECTAIANHERRPGRVAIGLCPTRTDDALCGQPLTATAASHRVRCGTCGTRWETLDEWRQLRAAQETADAEADAAVAVGRQREGVAA
jgi:hypothetical protein